MAQKDLDEMSPLNKETRNTVYKNINTVESEKNINPVDCEKTKNTEDGEKNTYTVDGEKTTAKKTAGKQRGVNVVLAIATVVVLSLAVIVVIVLIARTNNFNQEIQSLQLEVGNLREMLNQTENTRKTNDDTLTQEVQDIQTILNHLSGVGTFFNPASSCSDIPQDSPSGEYWIQNNNTNSPVQMYCDMNRNCSCNTTGRWTRVADLDMTDPSQQCPDGFRLVNRTTAPLRTCGRTEPGCVSTTFPVHGIEYSHVCGRIVGYQFGSPNAFLSYFTSTTIIDIDDLYVDGVSLTHGQQPRQHIWTFANSLDEVESDGDQSSCPCTQPDLPYTRTVPPFIGQDYFCETGSRDHWRFIFYSDVPLWDGQGCGDNSTCCSFNNPPWFCKQLPQPTTDDIELRLCGDQEIVNEDTPLEIVEIYIK